MYMYIKFLKIVSFYLSNRAAMAAMDRFEYEGREIAVVFAKDKRKTPDEMRSVLNTDELRLYDLIWKRTIASQMVDATGETVSVTMTAAIGDLGTATLSAAGTTITNRGFLAAYEEGQDQSRNDDDENES